jgi:hypothetical protein
MDKTQLLQLLATMTDAEKAQFMQALGGNDMTGMGMNMTGGYNPFRYGAFSSMYGMGGMPPQASGFRYRNEMNQYNNELARLNSETGAPTEETAAKIASIQNKMNDLSAARNSYVGNAVAGSAPGIVGSAIGIYDKYQALKELRKLNPEDFIPKELKSGITELGATEQEAKLRAASAKTSDDAFRREQMQQASNEAVQNSMLAATSPDQVQNAAIQAQKVRNAGIRQLGAEGQASQGQRRQYADSLGGQRRNLEMQMGFLREKERKNIQNQIDATKQGMMRDVMTGLNSVGQAFVTGGV